LFIFYFVFFIFFYFLYKFNIIDINHLKAIVNSFGAISFIILGMLYSFAFLAPVITAIFIFYSGDISNFQIALLAGLGIALADLFIYKVYEYKINDEIKSLEKTKFIKYFSKFKIFKDRLFMTFLGFIFIASPLPDSVGIMLIEEEKILKTKYFFFIDLILNMTAIYFYLSL